jgi:hypothetical protein
MAVSAVNIPSPPNANMDRAMFVWCGAANSAGDPLANDPKMQALLNFCSSKGVNVLFLDIWGYLGGGNWTTARFQTVQKFIHYAHASGIRVMALAGNTDWGVNQQWVARNILRNLMQYQVMQDSASAAMDGAGFDGVMLDCEYWTAPYTATDVVGLCDLMNFMRKALCLPVGCFTTQWLADPASAAISVTYNGVTQVEGLHLMDNSDFVVVGCYSNNSATQIGMFQRWFDYASLTGAKRNFGLWCGSETLSGLGTLSYWTGSAGALAVMETAHTAISSASTATPNTNATFRGQAVHAYSSYSQMT